MTTLEEKASPIGILKGSVAVEREGQRGHTFVPTTLKNHAAVGSGSKVTL